MNLEYWTKRCTSGNFKNTAKRRNSRKYTWKNCSRVSKYLQLNIYRPPKVWWLVVLALPASVRRQRAVGVGRFWERHRASPSLLSRLVLAGGTWL